VPLSVFSNVIGRKRSTFAPKGDACTLATSFSLPLLAWVNIPAGQVRLEGHASTFEIPAFKIAKYPVTNQQFAAFIHDGGYTDQRWWQDLAQAVKTPRESDWPEGDHPKLEVCWYEAMAFCRWLADKTEHSVRLPTEWEWQWAAVGDSAWDYPFGARFDATKCNTKEASVRRTNAVVEYEGVPTYFSPVDMAGNVWEWCLNEGEIPEHIQHGESANRALRGGSWNNGSQHARAAFRYHRTPQTRTLNIGFRLMMAM
jgi:formylglycine-generating enzyme required for sulfatase activity